jgi:hypothetical protein
MSHRSRSHTVTRVVSLYIHFGSDIWLRRLAVWPPWGGVDHEGQSEEGRPRMGVSDLIGAKCSTPRLWTRGANVDLGLVDLADPPARL